MNQLSSAYRSIHRIETDLSVIPFRSARIDLTHPYEHVNKRNEHSLIVMIGNRFQLFN